MVELTVSLTGVEQALADLHHASEHIDEAIRQAVPKAARDAVVTLAQATPVRTGRMQLSWESHPVDGLAGEVAAFEVTNSAPYAAYPITGTRRTAPSPHIHRAWLDAPATIGDDLERYALEALGF